MIFGDAASVSSAQIAKCAVAVVGLYILGANERGVEDAFISQTPRTTEFRLAFFLQQEQIFLAYPFWFARKIVALPKWLRDVNNIYS